MLRCKRPVLAIGFAVFVLNLASCKDDDDDKKGKSLGLALVKPPVVAATPKALSSTSLKLESSSLENFRSRFYSAGPTNILNLLDIIDGRVTGINQRTEDSEKACVSQEPVSYVIAFPGGDSQTFYAQCYEKLSSAANPDDFGQFGLKDGVSYLYYTVGAGHVAAKVTPNTADPSTYKVEAWFSVGVTNETAFDSGSYGVIHLTADSANSSLELAVAGIGFGYCGAQMQSKGANLYFKGSEDQGSTCVATADFCALSADGTLGGDCSGIQTFSIDALGRKAASGSIESGASVYPATPNITLDGKSSDDVHFGPSAPTDGVGDMGSGVKLLAQ